MRDDTRMSPMRSFDPRLIGRLETAAWVTYYRREWGRFLIAAVLLTRHTFGLGSTGTSARTR